MMRGRGSISSMWAWAGSSRRPSRRTAALAALAGMLLAAPAEGKVYLTQPEALARVFPPPARVERRTLFLDEAQAARVEKESGAPLPGRVVSYYVGLGESGVIGYAYFDSHRVRTLPETILVLVAPNGSISRIEILAFAEPEDYFPRGAWLEQFRGRRLDGDLALRRGIRNLTGASLTAEAITAACRRILALHRLAAGAAPP